MTFVVARGPQEPHLSIQGYTATLFVRQACFMTMAVERFERSSHNTECHVAPFTYTTVLTPPDTKAEILCTAQRGMAPFSSMDLLNM